VRSKSRRALRLRARKACGTFLYNMSLVQQLADTLVLGNLLQALRAKVGPYELLDHWQQGEFHHDVLMRVTPGERLPGQVLVVATNCNGGVKEVLCFDEVPERSALWHFRCPDAAEFAGRIPELRERATTPHWFNPCELLAVDARSELKAEHRQRQHGGGWEMSGSACAPRKRALE
jgi:hypothetical protein